MAFLQEEQLMSEPRPRLPLMRSILTVPANVERFLRKAPESGADIVCLDLEDSVPPGEKEAARSSAVAAVRELAAAGRAVFVRVNSLESGLLEDDLRAVVRQGLGALLLPKASSPEDVQTAGRQLTLLEHERGLPGGSVALVPLIETALAVMRCLVVCGSSRRVIAAVFGAEDFATDMGIERTPGAEEVRWARNQVAVACHAAGALPIDMADADYTDVDRLEQDMRYARSIGYRGKLCIHPVQVEIANRVFSPSPREVEEAREIVEAFEREGIARGLASISIRGKMVDTPVYERARRLLEWAESAG
jgi:citrate lyase subunit beta / citryl-CoA lyase